MTVINILHIKRPTIRYLLMIEIKPIQPELKRNRKTVRFEDHAKHSISLV